MIVLSNTIAQTVPVGQAITFNTVIKRSGNGECYRNNTNFVKLRANGDYEIHFSANVSGVAAGTPVQLTVEIGGSPLPETTMISTPSAADALNNVATATAVRNCCGDFDRITVVNTGTVDITIGANPVLYIKRVS